MSFQRANNNTFAIAPTFFNPYISRKLNNMDQAQVMKKEREDWTRLYHKMLKRIEAMIECRGFKGHSRRNEYNSHGDGRNNPDSQY